MILSPFQNVNCQRVREILLPAQLQLSCYQHKRIVDEITRCQGRKIIDQYQSRLNKLKWINWRKVFINFTPIFTFIPDVNKTCIFIRFLTDGDDFKSTLNHRRNSSNKLLLAKVSFTFHFNFKETNLALAQKENFAKFILKLTLRRKCTQTVRNIYFYIASCESSTSPLADHSLKQHKTCFVDLVRVCKFFYTAFIDAKLFFFFYRSVDTLTWLVIPFNLSTIRLIVTVWLTISCKCSCR